MSATQNTKSVDGAQKSRVIIDLENDVIKLIDEFKTTTGSKSRSSVVSQLLRELLATQNDLLPIAKGDL